MKQNTFATFSIAAICSTPLTLMGTAMPPRDPDEEDEEEDEEDEDEEREDDTDEPAVVREPDED
ncbi:hypothetical protein [Bradyrhizobium sp. 195]|uniref:hypothetical protein n=1 Tax=Bradyrhizobium sp. 195 TaxID=2782662 RepID=UPI0020011FF5|nr:hypothetical protein [Bradyrhizobium sp. 195]UPK26212.1 hypothetical protein IVB26_33835 [Bradyrhizobium sp. 195]